MPETRNPFSYLYLKQRYNKRTHQIARERKLKSKIVIKTKAFHFETLFLWNVEIIQTTERML